MTMEKRRVISEMNIGEHLKIENNKLTIDLTSLSGALPVDVYIDNAVYNEETGALDFTFAGGKEPVSVPLAQALGLNTKIKSFDWSNRYPETLEAEIVDTDDNKFVLSLNDVFGRYKKQSEQYTQQAVEGLMEVLSGNLVALVDLDDEPLGYVFNEAI